MGKILTGSWIIKLGIQTLSKFLYSHNWTLTNGAVFHSVCQVWFSSGPPELLATAYDCETGLLDELVTWLLWKSQAVPAACLSSCSLIHTQVASLRVSHARLLFGWEGPNIWIWKKLKNYKLIICWFYFNYEKIGLWQQWVTCSPATFFHINFLDISKF